MISINTKHSTDDEKSVKTTLERLIERYSPPLFTTKILIDSDQKAHSHPVLTLNTAWQEEAPLLKTYAHEQYHWYCDENPNKNKAINSLKSQYKDLGDMDMNRDFNPDSFWEHLIVCWNTRNYLKKVLKPEDWQVIGSTRMPYFLTEQFVRENFESLEKELSTLGVVDDGSQ